MQIHWEQTKALEPKTLIGSERDWKCGQDEDELVCAAHHEPSKLPWKKQQKIRPHFGTEKGFWESGHKIPSPSPRSSCHSVQLD